MLVTCQECAAAISDSANACPRCGAPKDVFLGAPTPCSECSAPFSPAYESCSSCGAPRDVARGAPVSPGQAQVRPLSAPLPNGQSTTAARSDTPVSDLGVYPWGRWGAKVLDVALYAGLLGVVFTLAGFNWYADNANGIFGLIMVATFPFWDAASIAMFGGSPGRAAFRIKIIEDKSGAKPSFSAAAQRSFGGWFFGCGLGIPIVTIVTMIMSKAYLEKHGRSRWDASAGTAVEQSQPSPLSWMIFAAVFLLLAFLRLSGNA